MKKLIILLVILVFITGCQKTETNPNATNPDDNPGNSEINTDVDDFSDIFYNYTLKDTDELVIAEEARNSSGAIYPFIYTSGELLSYQRETYIGPGEFEEKILYVKDLSSDEIRQVTKNPVDCYTFIELKNKQGILFAYKGSIYSLIDYGNKIERIYKGKEAININVYSIEDNPDYVYFVEGTVLKKLNLKTDEIEILFEHCDGDRYVIKADRAMFCQKYKDYSELVLEREYFVDLTNGSERDLRNEDEYNLFFFDQEYDGMKDIN